MSKKTKPGDLYKKFQKKRKVLAAQGKRLIPGQGLTAGQIVTNRLESDAKNRVFKGVSPATRKTAEKIMSKGDIYGGRNPKKVYKKRKSGLRPASVVVKSEQNASHQFYKKVKRHKMSSSKRCKMCGR